MRKLYIMLVLVFIIMNVVYYLFDRFFYIMFGCREKSLKFLSDKD